MKHITLPSLLVAVAVATVPSAHAVDDWKAGEEASQCHVHAVSTAGHYDLRFNVRRGVPQVLIRITRTDGAPFTRQVFNVNLRSFYTYAHPDNPARAAFGSYENPGRFTRHGDKSVASAGLPFDLALKWLSSLSTADRIGVTFEDGMSAGFDMRESWRGLNEWYKCVHRLTGVEINRPQASVPSRVVEDGH